MIMADSSNEPVKLAIKVQYRFHYEDNYFNGETDESSIEVYAWNNSTSDWELVNGFELDTDANLITYESETVSNFVILTNSNLATSTVDVSPIIPDMIILKQNYPNPFNPQTNIECYISNKSNVTLNVYNILSQNVFQFNKAEMDAGTHTVQFGGSAFSSGIYFYELLVDDKSACIKKMSLLR